MFISIAVQNKNIFNNNVVWNIKINGYQRDCVVIAAVHSDFSKNVNSAVKIINCCYW